MIHPIKRYLAIRSYIVKLPAEMARRLGTRPTYKLELVSKAVKGSKLSMDPEFLAYAHAAYASREDFQAHYGPLKVAFTYDSLREVIARRYFNGARDFNSENLIANCPPRRTDEEHYHQNTSLDD